MVKKRSKKRSIGTRYKYHGSVGRFAEIGGKNVMPRGTKTVLIKRQGKGWYGIYYPKRKKR